MCLCNFFSFVLFFLNIVFPVAHHFTFLMYCCSLLEREGLVGWWVVFQRADVLCTILRFFSMCVCVCWDTFFVYNLENSIKRVLKRKEKALAVRNIALVPVLVNYHPHTDSRLISIILFIHFPGEPRIIIAFRTNPISQPLILH